MIDLSTLIEPSKAFGGGFILFVLLEMIYASRKGGARFEAKDTASSILMGLGSTIAGGIAGGSRCAPAGAEVPRIRTTLAPVLLHTT